MEPRPPEQATSATSATSLPSHPAGVKISNELRPPNSQLEDFGKPDAVVSEIIVRVEQVRLVVVVAEGVFFCAMPSFRIGEGQGQENITRWIS
mmetsp:Transcript_10285/g.20727  ORF Transcript_10285/g.20727 Transcript_10285/m.20727 type:complete len:93 (+) Transcript_10285:104-382(+)